MDTPDDEVARRFRENDTLGDPSSFWYRAMRPYFEEQKPVGAMRLLSTGPTVDEQLPLGLFTHTKKNRLIYWPALAKGTRMLCDGKTMNVVDHFTLEFPSEKMHLTYFSDSGKRKHMSNAARVVHFDGLNLAVCFQVLVKVNVVRNQDMEIQRKVPSSPAHQTRMIEWLRAFAESFSCAPTHLAPDYGQRDFIHYAVFLGSHSASRTQLPQAKTFLGTTGLEHFVDNWETGEECRGQLTPFTVADKQLYLATFCPPGVLKHPTAFLIARRRQFTS